MEILTRLGFAVLLSVLLAVLLAWGWDQSDAPNMPEPVTLGEANATASLR